jgi:uncharacterized protein YndB with AHSA1/START domain
MPTKTKNPDNCVGLEFVITREYAAPRELVWQACTDPKHLAQWWGPKGFSAPVCEWDTRPGGKIFVIMRGPDGTDYPMGGEVRDVVAPEMMVSMSGALDDAGNYLFQFLHTLTLIEREGKTQLMMHSRVIHATPGAGRYIGGFETGMTMSLERLGDHLVEQAASAREIVMAREFDAPRELVWAAMTDPEQVIHWWGPRGFTTTIEQMDVRPGGVWKHVMHGPDGANYPSECVFQEVAAPSRLVFAQGGKREGGPSINFVSTWTFDTVASGKTKVTIRMVFPTADARDLVVREFGAIEGAKQTLERLDEHLATLAKV